MESNIKLYSEIERFEIININDGERYNCLENNDIIIDTNGNFKFLLLNSAKSKFSFFGSTEYTEVPWECVKKIGTRAIIMDANNDSLNRSKV